MRASKSNGFFKRDKESRVKGDSARRETGVTSKRVDRSGRLEHRGTTGRAEGERKSEIPMVEKRARVVDRPFEAPLKRANIPPGCTMQSSIHRGIQLAPVAGNLK